MTITIEDSGNPSGTYSTNAEVIFQWSSATDDPGMDGNIVSTVVNISPYVPDDIKIINGVTSATVTGKHYEVFQTSQDALRYIDNNDNYQTRQKWNEMPPPGDPSIQEFYFFQPNTSASQVFTYSVTVTTDLNNTASGSYNTNITNDWTAGRDLVKCYVRNECDISDIVFVNTTLLTLTGLDHTVEEINTGLIPIDLSELVLTSNDHTVLANDIVNIDLESLILIGNDHEVSINQDIPVDLETLILTTYEIELDRNIHIETSIMTLTGQDATIMGNENIMIDISPGFDNLSWDSDDGWDHAAELELISNEHTILES